MRLMLSYVDPGLGLLVWQAIVAAFLGVLFYVRKSRDKMLAWGIKLLRMNKSARPSPVEDRPPRGEPRR